MMMPAREERTDAGKVEVRVPSREADVLSTLQKRAKPFRLFGFCVCLVVSLRFVDAY